MLKKLCEKFIRKQENDQEVESIKAEMKKVTDDTTKKLKKVNSLLASSVTADLSRVMGGLK